MTVAAIIVAAGKGERAGGGIPKQFMLLGGKPMFLHSVEALAAHPRVDAVILVIPPGERERVSKILPIQPVLVNIVEGGATRQQSVRNGLNETWEMDVDQVLIHDAARSFVPPAVVDRLIDALDEHAGAVPCLPVVDTLIEAATMMGKTVDRSRLMRVQTPQAFHRDALSNAHDHALDDLATDDAQLVRAVGGKIAVVEGDALLEKITTSTDFAMAEARLAAGKTSRTGMGYDVHRLEAGQELWLGGILIPHDRGLSGHSDADVAIHALVDALLGAAGDGDIGSHFPPSDPQWRGAASSRFLEHARDRIAARGGIVDHVDLTIICEAPRIGPHRDAMRARIAELLRIDPGQVSVKATTTERLGFTGRREGIAAQAVATIRI